MLFKAAAHKNPLGENKLYYSSKVIVKTSHLFEVGESFRIYYFLIVAVLSLKTMREAPNLYFSTDVTEASITALE